MAPKKVGFSYKTRLPSSCKLKEVRVVPRQVGYTLELVYEKIIPKPILKKTRKAGVDLGVVNLVTFVDNLESQPIVVKDHGKGIKSIINYYQKGQKQLRALYVQQQKKQLKKQKKLVYGKAYYRLQNNYRKRLKNALHLLTNYVIMLCRELNIHELVVGYNPNWKQRVNLRKKVTQMFVCIPFHRILHQLQYKGEEHGIHVELLPESHTSKSSFIDNEFPQHRTNYAGKRSPRGLFTSKQGHKLNSDVNAAYNILTKSDPHALPPRSAAGVGGYVMYPRRVSVDPPGMTQALATK